VAPNRVRLTHCFFPTMSGDIPRQSTTLNVLFQSILSESGGVCILSAVSRRYGLSFLTSSDALHCVADKVMILVLLIEVLLWSSDNRSLQCHRDVVALTRVRFAPGSRCLAVSRRPLPLHTSASSGVGLVIAVLYAQFQSMDAKACRTLFHSLRRRSTFAGSRP